MDSHSRPLRAVRRGKMCSPSSLLCQARLPPPHFTQGVRALRPRRFHPDCHYEDLVVEEVGPTAPMPGEDKKGERSSSPEEVVANAEAFGGRFASAVEYRR